MRARLREWFIALPPGWIMQRGLAVLALVFLALYIVKVA